MGSDGLIGKIEVDTFFSIMEVFSLEDIINQKFNANFNEAKYMRKIDSAEIRKFEYLKIEDLYYIKTLSKTN